MPIIIISARGADWEQVMGIDLGADDYLVKPFSPQVLVAKVKAALRRTYGEYGSEGNLTIGELKLDATTLSVSYQSRVQELSKNEFKLLKKLMEQHDRIVSRQELFELLWDDSTFVEENTLNVNITRVKHKLQELGLADIIRTKRGIGYLLDSSLLAAEGPHA